MRVKIDVLLEAERQVSDDGFSILGGIPREAIALEVFDECLGHVVRS